MFLFLHSAFNRIFFEIRRRMRWGRRNYTENAVGKLSALTPEQSRRIDELKKKYDVCFESRLNEPHALENYHMLDLLDECSQKFSWVVKPGQKLVDVGSKNFCYLFAQQAFFKPSYLTGLEIDAFPLYHDLHTRYSYAKHFVSHFKNADYFDIDFLDYAKDAHGLLMFYPFVVCEPLVAWFLPLSEFKPQAFFNHAMEVLNKSGWLFMVNWDEEEYQEAEKYAKQAGFSFCWRHHHTHPLYFKSDKAIVSLWNKPF